MQHRPPSSHARLTPRWLLVASLPGWACVDGPGESDAIPVADFEGYVRDVQPVFERRCSERNCHGNDGRPLGLFSPGRHRLDPTNDDPNTDLGPEELRANFDRSRSFLAFASTPESCELVTKPLAIAVGGVGHGAGAVFTTTIDDEYLDILDWVDDALAEDVP